MDRLTTTLLLLSLALGSCEGFSCAVGTVKDAATGRPLDGVRVDVLTGVEEILTDSTGTFHVCNKLSGWMRTCGLITVRFTKGGYKFVELNDPEAGVEVKMERE